MHPMMCIPSQFLLPGGNLHSWLSQWIDYRMFWRERWVVYTRFLPWPWRTNYTTLTLWNWHTDLCLRWFSCYTTLFSKMRTTERIVLIKPTRRCRTDFLNIEYFYVNSNCYLTCHPLYINTDRELMTGDQRAVGIIFHKYIDKSIITMGFVGLIVGSVNIMQLKV